MAVDESKKKGAQGHPFWDFWGPVLFMLALYLGIRQFLVEARYIPSGSMLPGRNPPEEKYLSLQLNLKFLACQHKVRISEQ